MKKQEKGITLIALIITIVVLMILAVVTINSVKDGGIITHAQKAAVSYKEAQIEEEVGIYSMEYYMNNKRSMKEETISAMELMCKEIGVSPEKLTVHYNKYDGSEYVLYRIDKVTEEERTILEQKGVKPLKGDADLDGVLTVKDVKLIEEAEVTWEINGTEIIDENGNLKEEWLDLCDIDNDGMISSNDASLIEYNLSAKNEDSIYTGGYWE